MHELVLPLNSKKLGGFRTDDRSYLRGGPGNSKRYKCSDVRSSGSRARPVSKEVIPEGRRDVARGRREAGSAHTTAARKKGSEALPSQRCLGENGKAR